MPKLNRNALSAGQLRHARPGSCADGNGLMLPVRPSGSRSWVQRLMVQGCRPHRVPLSTGALAWLAPVEGSKTVAAQARDDLLEKRRPFCQHA